jgi:phosphoglycerate dehydrogenase-like enzyme
LNSPSGLTAVALDVTDPEPLPAGHPLFTHPRAIITPHTSGGWEGYFDDGADVLLYQAERIKAGREPVNVVDPAKGY